MHNPDHKKVDNAEKDAIEDLFYYGKRTIIENNHMEVLSPKMTFDNLRLLTNGDPCSNELIDLLSSQKGVEKILKLFDLDLYFFRGIFDTNNGQTKNLVKLSENGVHTTNGAEIWLPWELATIIKIIGDEFYKKFKQHLEICSGYRSPAYQIYLICYYGSRIFDKNGVHLGHRTLEEVLKTAAPPGCSEHQLVYNPAFDVTNFRTDTALMTIPEIRQIIEWKWFKRRAEEMEIEETYGQGTNNNGLGEPWHFRKIS